MTEVSLNVAQDGELLRLMKGSALSGAGPCLVPAVGIPRAASLLRHRSPLEFDSASSSVLY